jgi:hypothetical protein
MNRVFTMVTLLLVWFSLLIHGAGNAQVPGRISYQAVIRDNNNNLVNNRTVGIRVSILQGSETGGVVYSETHTTSTNANGLVSLELGTGAGLGQINWSQGPYFIRTQTDPQGGSNYTISGTSRILAVPYALHAGTADRIAGFDLELIGNITPEDIERWNSMANALTETDPVFSAWDRSSGVLITESQISDLKNYLTTISGESIGTLADVDLTGISPGKVLKYNAGTGKWVIADDLGITVESDPLFAAWDKSTGISITESQISDLKAYLTEEQDPAVAANFDFTGAATGDLLMYNGTKWVKTTPQYLTGISGESVGSLSDVDLTNIADGKVLKYDATLQKWVAADDEISLEAIITDITDNLDLSGAAQGDLLYYDGTKWVKFTPNYLTQYTETDPAFTANFDFTGAADGDLLMYDNGMWVKFTPDYISTEADPLFSLSAASGISAADIAAWNNKVDKVTGKGLSTNDYTTAEKTKLDGIAAGAEVNVQSDWNVADSNSDAFILNKPDLDLLATKVALTDSISLVRSQIPDVSDFITTEDETDPVFLASPANEITEEDITNLGNLSGINTGDQDLSGLATKVALTDSISLVRSQIPDVSDFITTEDETDPVFLASPANEITEEDITNLVNLSGVNTGDQDLSGLATKVALTDSISLVRSQIPDVSEFITSAEETDPVFVASPANEITEEDITNLSNLSGVNTGDQDLSGLATKVALTDSISLVRSQIPDVSDFITTEDETDPVFLASPANEITEEDITNLGNLSGVNTGDQDLSGLATKVALTDSISLVRSQIPDVSDFITTEDETDPVFVASPANEITEEDITNLVNLSGVNTGDQDLSGLATKVALTDSISLVRSQIPDVSEFITSADETDPVFLASPANEITEEDITNLSNLSGVNTGDQDLSGLATKVALTDSISLVRSQIPDVSEFITTEDETDPVFLASPANEITEEDITNLGNLSGVNTGDQDLSGLATKVALTDSISLVRSQIPDVSDFITTEDETDPVFLASPANEITEEDITNLGNLSGVNTGDQDLSGLATKVALTDSISLVRSQIPDVSDFITTEDETDPVFLASPANEITEEDITNLGNLSGVNTGDQDLSGLATKVALTDSISLVRSQIPDVSEFITSAEETDPVFVDSPANDITADDITNLSNLSGVNTGDQDLSGLATKVALKDSISLVRSQIPDVSEFITTEDETDPVFVDSPANDITADDITNLSNLSGVNTGDQDLSGLATKVALKDSISLVRSQIPDVSEFITTEDETDPVFVDSPANDITADDITNLSNLSGVNTGDQDLSGLATKVALKDSISLVRSQIPDVSEFITSAEETDPVFVDSPANDITADDITNLSNLSGVNTGDQDLSGLATKVALKDSISLVRSQIPDVSEFITSAEETDPVFVDSPANDITADDITNLSNLSGVNTGDQDLSGLATKVALKDSISLVRSQIPDVSEFITSAEETDPVFVDSPANDITADDITNLSNLSGVNTGDQDLSGLATKVALKDSISLVRSQIPDVSDFITTEDETDPVFDASEAKNITDAGSGKVITDTERTKLDGIEANATKTIFTVDEYTVTDEPSATYELINTPRADSKLLVSLNGMELRQTSEYTLSNKILTISVPLYEYDRITVSYTY